LDAYKIKKFKAFVYLIEYIVGPAATPTTDITNNRRSMSSPGGEETGEGGQFYANGAISVVHPSPITTDPLI
jgi:hypothetical protein